MKNKIIPNNPAKNHKNKTKRGNDGDLWISLKDKNGIYRWNKKKIKIKIE